MAEEICSLLSRQLCTRSQKNKVYAISLITQMKKVRLNRLTTKHKVTAMTLYVPWAFAYIQPNRVARPANKI